MNLGNKIFSNIEIYFEILKIKIKVIEDITLTLWTVENGNLPNSGLSVFPTIGSN